ncbi:MAG: glycosyltransferase family 2 protein [Saprospiraceae bacterium]|nr:glycosyltransferase family 2 protein [Saprospiraceae bacterium]
MRKQPLISVITVNYNGLHLTVELLNSIRRITYTNLEVFVVDNASRENPQPYLEKHYPEVYTIRSEQNLGFAGGNNLAVSVATGDYLFFINNDAEITEGCLERLIAAFSTDDKIGMVSPLICYYNESKKAEIDLIQYAGMTQVHHMTARNTTIGEKTFDNGQFTKIEKTAYAHGAAMMVRRDVIEKVGVMFEDFFLYYEELDWCERVRRAGFEIVVEPNAKIYHKESASVGAMSTLKTYYINRNRIYFMRRNFQGLNFLMFCLFLTFITIPKNLLKYLFKGEFAHAKAFLKAIFWNINDGFTHFFKDKPTESTIKMKNIKTQPVETH